MRRAAKVDLSQAEIVRALRSVGVYVLLLNGVGNGCPDAACWYRGVWVWLEFKTPGQGRLTVAQVEFIEKFPGLYHVVTSPAEALSVVVEAARPNPPESPDGSAARPQEGR
jgi:hypothetical protein